MSYSIFMGPAISKVKNILGWFVKTVTQDLKIFCEMKNATNFTTLQIIVSHNCDKLPKFNKL